MLFDAILIYDTHEYETEVQGLKGLRKRLAKILERLGIKFCDRVIVVSDAIANEYVRLYDIPKPALVLNTPPYQEIKKRNLFRKKFGIAKERPIFLYQGGLGKGRGIETLLDTFERLHEEKERGQAPVIVFMGYGPLEDQVKKAAQAHENIFFHPAVSPDVLLDYTSSADFGISLIEDVCLSYRYSLPNKMFEYLMADLPVIVSNLPEMRRIVEEYEVGVVAERNNPEGLKSAVEEAMRLDREALIKRIRRVKRVYNWEAQERVLLKIYEDMKK
jgi:glycosyltransferase involved in cell wall biosynthesis